VGHTPVEIVNNSSSCAYLSIPVDRLEEHRFLGR
jgi:hypothetical protein